MTLRLRQSARKPLRLCAAAAGAVLALGFLVQPATAAAPTVRITAPGAHDVVGDSTPNISGDAQMNDGEILEVVASISSAEGHPVPGAHRIGGDGRSSVSFSWTPALSYNGNYTVTVRASGEDQPFDTNGSESAETSSNFAIEAPPSTPRDVSVRADPDSREVDVTWKANPEPDLIGYQVQRSVDESEWGVAGESDESFFRDARSAYGGGTYSYRVVAVRAGASPDSGVASAPSEAATTTVPDPPGGSTDEPGESPGEPDTGPSGDGSNTGGSGGSGTSGGGSGTSGGSGGTGSGGARGPTISRSGRVDLSGFGSLLDQTRLPEIPTAPEPDPGFSEELPFQPRTITEPDGEIAIPEGGFNDAGSDRAELLRFFAAGLLLTVILMHVLWLRSEVERVPLEAVASTQR